MSECFFFRWFSCIQLRLSGVGDARLNSCVSTKVEEMVCKIGNLSFQSQSFNFKKESLLSNFYFKTFIYFLKQKLQF